MYGNSEVAASQCVMMVKLKGPLEVVDSFTGTGSRVPNQAEAKMPVLPIRVLLVTMIGDCQLQKNSKGAMPAKGPWHLR